MENNIENTENKGTNSKNQSQIAGAILIVGIMIAGAILLKGNMAPNPIVSNNQQQEAVKKIDIKPISQDDHILGNPNAKIIIVEYSDTECPFCKVFHYTMQKIVDNNQGQVAWVYRHFPIDSLHQKAFHEAEATECAWDQGGNDMFWKYLDEMMKRTQSNDKLDVAELPKIASFVGLNLAKFNTCLDSGKFASKINSQIMDAKNAGAQGTPHSIIVTKKEITTEVQDEILIAVGNPRAVSFNSTKSSMMSMNGALPVDMVNKIISILLK
ncbi:MAG: thioredoxin domain-containing protein [Candidatus Pacebacteria bacterium]|nr:thioredoxin domain-containing protein [Candidatus Paceibacterota bacterium]